MVCATRRGVPTTTLSGRAAHDRSDRSQASLWGHDNPAPTAAVGVPIRPHTGGYGHRGHRIAWSDRRFYDWLTTVGLTPAKSLTLGPLAIPDDYFADFLRGCIDGDGSVRVYIDRYHTAKRMQYVYRASIRVARFGESCVSGVDADDNS